MNIVNKNSCVGLSPSNISCFWFIETSNLIYNKNRAVCIGLLFYVRQNDNIIAIIKETIKHQWVIYRGTGKGSSFLKMLKT